MSDIKIGSREGFTVIPNDLHISGNVTADGSGLGGSSETVNLTIQTSTGSMTPAAGTVELFASSSTGVVVSVMTPSGSVFPLNSELLYAQSDIYADPGQSLTMQQYGFLSDLNHESNATNITASNGVTVLEQRTAGTAGSNVWVETDDEFVWGVEARPFVFGKFGTYDSGNVRIFVGLSTIVGASNLDNDAITPEHIGIQYSTARPDTTWQFTSSGSGGQSLVDTGVGVSSFQDQHFLIDCEGSGQARVTIFDGAMNEQFSHVFGDTEVPTANQPMFFFAGCQTQTTTTRWFRHFFYKLRARGVWA